MKELIKVRYDEQYGVIATCRNTDLADELEDFLTERVYVFFELRFIEGNTEFLFGQASSVDAVTTIIDLFEA